VTSLLVDDVIVSVLTRMAINNAKRDVIVDVYKSRYVIWSSYITRLRLSLHQRCSNATLTKRNFYTHVLETLTFLTERVHRGHRTRANMAIIWVGTQQHLGPNILDHTLIQFSLTVAHWSLF